MFDEFSGHEDAFRDRGSSPLCIRFGGDSAQADV